MTSTIKKLAAEAITAFFLHPRWRGRRDTLRSGACLTLCCMFLLMLSGCRNEAVHSAMLARLDSLQRENEAYKEFTSDSLQTELCRYFDRHGSRNERMKAHYLLGRAYHDMGEIPHALECYQDAAQCADTTDRDCDYYRLAAVYGQLSEIYHWQNLPDEELNAYKAYSHFSLKAGDTLGYIKGYELEIGTYALKRDTDKILEITNHSHDLYEKYGYKKEAASAYGTAIFVYLNRGQYAKAKMLMDIYEKQSGFFDKLGHIEKGREIYYYSQGLYQLGINNLDSAEYLFRKSALSGQPDAPAKGLLMVYEKRGNKDSIAKYANLYAYSYDSIYNGKMTETVEQIASMYNYNRYKQLAEQSTAKAEQQLFIIILLVSLIVVIVIGIIIYNNRRKRKITSLLLKRNNLYSSILDKLREKEEQIIILQTDSNKLLEKYHTDINSLQIQLKRFHDDETEIINYNNKLIDTLHNYARRVSGVPTKEEWEEFERIITTTDPDFITFIGNIKSNLNSRDRIICMLIRKQFISSEISILLNLTPSALSVRKRFINRKLFHRNSAEHLEKYISQYKKRS